MKTALSLLSIAFIIFMFTFYMDGEMGVILIAFLIAAPLISLFFTLHSRKRIKISFDCDGYVKTGNELEVRVVVQREGKLPLSIVEITPFASEVFSDHDKVYKLSLFSEDRVEFKFKFVACTGGNGEIGIKSVKVCDFLGFIKFRTICEMPPCKSVGVIPEIPDVNASSGLFRAIADVVLTSEDSEENDTAMMFSANTTPGYEHREYIPGDSLKRVNWKLSSKSSKLMVRLDEAAAVVQPSIVLDLFRSSDVDLRTSLKREERLLQSVFGLLNLLIKQGIACNFIYCNENGDIVTESVDNPDYPSQLLLKILALKVNAGTHMNPVESIRKSCAGILAVTYIDEYFTDIIDNIASKENVSVIVPFAESVKSLSVPVWYLADDSYFRLI